MSTLYLDHPDLRMSLEHGALVLHRAGVRVRSVPLGLLDRIIVQGDVALSAGVLGRLAEAGVALAVCSRRHSRQQARLVGAGHNDARIRLAQYHAADRAELKLRLARHAVALRLRGQSLLLAELLGARPDARKPLFDATSRSSRCARR